MTKWHALLGGVAVVLMTWAGSQRAAAFIETTQQRVPDLWGECLYLSFVGYVLPMLLILAAHEYGHLWACRKHRVKTSFPYLIPLPLMLTGHGGAYLPILEPPPSRRALFDIAAAGPIAGFVMTLPCLVVGMALSAPIPMRAVITSARYRMPEVMQWVSAPMFGPGVDVVVHPLAWAAWLGFLVTAINLFPFMQLDGGQIVLAVWPKGWLPISVVTLLAVGWLSMGRASWSLFFIAMIVMAPFCGLRPASIADTDPVGPWRIGVAVLCAVLFAISVTPIDVR